MIRLYEVSGQAHYALQAKKLAAHVLTHFSTAESTLFAYSSDQSESLAAPYYELFDNVIPASNSVMARVLFYLAHLFEEPSWGQRSSEMLRDMQDKLDKYSSSFTNWGILLMHHTRPFHTIVIAGPEATQKARELHARFLPDAIVAAADTEEAAAKLPLFANRFVPEKTMFHVCTQGHCKMPVDEPEKALQQMS